MKFILTNDLAHIRRLHMRIFSTPFPLDSYARKLRNGKKLWLLDMYEDDAPALIGYYIVIDEPDKLTLRGWLGGVLPEYRGGGVTKEFYSWVIRRAREMQYRYVTGNTDNFKPGMIFSMLKLGFDIVGFGETAHGDKRKIMMRYEIHPALRLRLSVTANCNLRCFFCHGEGVRVSQNAYASLPEIDELLIQAYKLHTTEITVTGGEPLLNPDALRLILGNCSRWAELPEIKIATNGLPLTDEMISALSGYPGKLSLHISLHSLDSDIRARISGIDIPLAQYDALFDRLRRSRIRFRINCAALKNLNASPADIAKLTAYAAKVGASSLTLLELLVTKRDTALQPYYIGFSELNGILQQAFPGRASLAEENEKKRTFKIETETGSFPVSVYRLSCRVGCSECASQSDVTIGPDMKCHPCYLEPEYACGNACSLLTETLRQRESFLKKRNPDFARDELYWNENDSISCQ